MPGAVVICTVRPLSAAIYEPQVNLHWRRPAETRPLPSFFLHTLSADEPQIRAQFRAMIDGRPFESVLPNTWTQYLSDLKLLDALATHPARVYSPQAAQWHVLDAAMYTSYLVGQIGASASHATRMADLERTLVSHPLWRARGARWLVIQPHYDLKMIIGDTFALQLARRNELVGPVILATVDRSGTNIGRQKELFDLYRRALMVPHVATPELAHRAAACAQSPSSCGHMGSVEPLSRREERGGREGGGKEAAGGRSGWMFHGDMQRFDGGVRGAMRTIIGSLAAPTSLQARMISRGLAGDGNPDRSLSSPRLEASAGHVGYRQVSAATTEAMLNASLCFSPAGDMMTTRRLFDTLAAGCVPVLLKAIGNAPKQWLLGNNPFQHSIDWRAIGIYMAPRSVSMAERGQSQNPTVAPSKKVTAATRPKGACRLEEALWLDRVHNDTRLLRAMRRKAAAAFRAHLDVEFNPTGAAQALVRELAHVVDDDCEARHYIEAYNAKHREKRPQRSMSKNGYLYLPSHPSLLDEEGIAASGSGCRRGEEMLMEVPLSPHAMAKLKVGAQVGAKARGKVTRAPSSSALG